MKKKDWATIKKQISFFFYLSTGGWKRNHTQVAFSLRCLGQWLTTWRSPWSQRSCSCHSCWESQHCTSCWASPSSQLCRAWCCGTTTPHTERRDVPSSSSLLHSTLWATCTTSSSQRFCLVEMSASCRCALLPLEWFWQWFLWFTPREVQDLWLLPSMKQATARRTLRRISHTWKNVCNQQPHVQWPRQNS